LTIGIRVREGKERKTEREESMSRMTIEVGGPLAGDIRLLRPVLAVGPSPGTFPGLSAHEFRDLNSEASIGIRKSVGSQWKEQASREFHVKGRLKDRMQILN